MYDVVNDKCGRLQLQKQVMKHKYHTFIPQCIGSIVVMKAIQVIYALAFDYSYNSDYPGNIIPMLRLYPACSFKKCQSRLLSPFLLY